MSREPRAAAADSYGEPDSHRRRGHGYFAPDASTRTWKPPHIIRLTSNGIASPP